MAEELKKVEEIKETKKDGNKYSKDVTNNQGNLKDSNTHYENSKEFAETYYSREKIAEFEKIASYLKAKGYFSGGETSSSEDDDNEGGSGNTELYSLPDYKGPDNSKTPVPNTSEATGYGMIPGNSYKTGIKAKIKGADRWNKEILQAAKKEKVDPMLLKIISALESNGDPNVGRSSDGHGSVGLMQITPGMVGFDFDVAKANSDVSYALEQGAKVCHGKATACKSAGEPSSVKNIARRYNGAGALAEAYAGVFAEIYEGFPGLKATNDYRNMQGIKKDSKDKGGQKDNGKFIVPIENPIITSNYGSRWGTQHRGIDFGHPEGTPIMASRAGEVIHASNSNDGYGNMVALKHNDCITVYAHQSRMNCKVGDKVKQKQVIGYVGTTGDSTGNHLHFEIQMGQTLYSGHVDPRKYLDLPASIY